MSDTLSENYSKLNKRYQEIKNQLADLEAKLAEKEEQAKQLKIDLRMYKSVNEFLNGYGVEKAREVLLQTEKTKQQDKISFAVEQLEQIRKEFEIKFKGCKWEDKMLVGKFCNITNEIIDNQINVLRNNFDKG